MRIECQQLTKAYDRAQGELSALESVTFSVDENEFVGIVGPSGCGKTTLLKIIAGLLDPTSGRVLMSGAPEGGLPVSALVFQDHGLFPWMTVLDNVAFGLEMHGAERSDRYAQARDFIDRVGLAQFADAYPDQLSVGMRQRVGIVRAFVTNTPLLLMDEPFGALDSQTRLVLQEELLRIWERHRKVVIFVTHDIDEAIRMSDRILVMSGRPGRILEEVPIPLLRPRQIAKRKTADVADIKWHIWGLLEEQVRESLWVGRMSRAAAPPEFSGAVERWGPVLSAIGMLSAWELLSRAGFISPMFFPPPSAIAVVLWGMLAGGGLLVDTGITVARVIAGFTIGAGSGMLLGLAMGASPRLGAQLDPWVAALHPTPKIAVLPLILVIFGIGEASKVTLAALGAFFPMLINTIAGVRQISPIYFEVARSYGAGRVQLFTCVLLPGSLPLVMAGARIAVNVALMLTIAAELVVAQRGLGQVIWFAWQTLRIEEVYAGLFVTSVLGMALSFFLERFSRWVMPWRTAPKTAAR